MRIHLLETALSVFAAKGLETSIDDVIKVAEVSRGTFYNYFHTIGELTTALGEHISTQLIHMTEAATENYQDPAFRIGIGLRLIFHSVKANPQMGSFIWKAGFHSSLTFSVLRRYFSRHIEDAHSSGQLKIENVEIGVDLARSICVGGTLAISTQKVATDYSEQMTKHLLMSIGLPLIEIEKIIAFPLPQFGHKNFMGLSG